MSATRGCDSVPKNDPSKGLIRALRYEILVPFCEKPSSFIDDVSSTELLGRMQAVASNFDHYPVHFLLHLMQAAEIIGFKLPYRGHRWASFYRTLCHKMHVNPETEQQLDARLNADEKTFAAAADIEAEVEAEVGLGSVGADALSTWPFELRVGAAGAGGTREDPPQGDGSPMRLLLSEAFVEGYVHQKNGRCSHNPYDHRHDGHSLWEAGFCAANAAKHNHYPDPRPRQEGYDAYYDGVLVRNNPYHGTIGSQDWTKGWQWDRTTPSRRTVAWERGCSTPADVNQDPSKTRARSAASTAVGSTTATNLW